MRQRRESRTRMGDQEAPKPTLNGALAATCDATNQRVWRDGRREWNDADLEFATHMLGRILRRMPAPYPGLADRIDPRPPL